MPTLLQRTGGRGLRYSVFVHNEVIIRLHCMLMLIYHPCMHRSFDELEAEMLQGQKLQVHQTAMEYIELVLPRA